MLNNIISMFPNGNGKILTNWRQVNEVILIRTNVWKQRFNPTADNFTPGVELIRYLLLNIDTQHILSIPNDADRYSLVIAYLADARRTSFDPIYTGIVPHSLFSYGNRIDEIILNTSLSYPTRVYPFDKPFDRGWSDLRSITLLHHDANELLTGMLNWRITFDGNPPSYLLFQFDVTTLLFKYIKYVEWCNKTGLVPSTTSFIKTYELVHLFDDFHRIWTVNLLSGMIAAPTEEASLNVLLSSTVPQFYISIPQLKRVVADIEQMKQLLATANIRVQDFLATNWLPKDSLLGYINQLEFQSLPSVRQYKPLQLLKELPYLNLIFSISNHLSKSSSQYQQLNLRMTYEVRDMERNQITGTILNNKVNAIVDRSLDYFKSLLVD